MVEHLSHLYGSDTVLRKHFDILDFWYRVEFQHRGSPHIHGLLWLANAPDISNLNFETTDEEKEIITDYFDKLISARNPDPNIEYDIDPCGVEYYSIDDSEHFFDLARLLNHVQRHTKCTVGYCKKSKESQCRFKFPKKLSTSSKLQYDEKQDSFSFVPEHNDDRLNPYNRVISEIWSANIDIQSIVARCCEVHFKIRFKT